MKTKKEKTLKMAVKLLTATKGKEDTALILRQVFDEMEKVTSEVKS